MGRQLLPFARDDLRKKLKIDPPNIGNPFKKPSARKSFAPLVIAHPPKAIISSKSSPLLVVFQPLEVSKSLKVRQKRGAWAQMLNKQSDVKLIFVR